MLRSGHLEKDWGEVGRVLERVLKRSVVNIIINIIFTSTFNNPFSMLFIQLMLEKKKKGHEQPGIVNPRQIKM